MHVCGKKSLIFFLGGGCHRAWQAEDYSFNVCMKGKLFVEIAREKVVQLNNVQIPYGKTATVSRGCFFYRFSGSKNTTT